MKKATYLLLLPLILIFVKDTNAQVYATSQASNVSGLCIGCGIAAAPNSVDVPITNYETMNLTVSVLGANVAQKFTFPSTASVGYYAGIVVEDPSLGSLNSTTLNSLSITTYLSGVSNADTKNAASMLISNIGGSQWKMEFTATDAFNQMEVKFNAGIAGAMNSVHIYYAYYTVTAPLPIELLLFEAQPGNKAIHLNWATASEHNNDHFTVEKSTDAIHYAEVATVNGSGTSTDVNKYAYSDVEPLTGLSYYRLKQTDFDGHSSYFNALQVTYAKQFNYSAYPNPSGNDILHLVTPYAGTTVKMINTSGQLVFSKTYSDAGDHTEDLSALTDQLVPGLYLISFTSGGGAQTIRQIIQ